MHKRKKGCADEKKRRLRVVGRTLQNARLGKGLTQEILARRLGKTQSYIAKTEQGKRKICITDVMCFLEACEASPSHFIALFYKERKML